MAANEKVQKYYDALLASYDILIDAVAKANERGSKVTQQLAADVAAGQREAIELGRKLAAEPTDLGQFYTAVLEATTAAQGRALNFAQATYQETVAAGTDARATLEKLVAANKETTQAAVEAARAFAAANPFADVVRKGFEAFTPKAGEPAKKQKAAV
jgi:hypothetical protein